MPFCSYHNISSIILLKTSVCYVPPGVFIVVVHGLQWVFMDVQRFITDIAPIDVVE